MDNDIQLLDYIFRVCRRWPPGRVLYAVQSPPGHDHAIASIKSIARTVPPPFFSGEIAITMASS